MLEKKEKPKDEVESFENRRRRELVADIDRVQAEMKSLDLRMRLFHGEHFALFDGRLV